MDLPDITSLVITSLRTQSLTLSIFPWRTAIIAYPLDVSVALKEKSYLEESSFLENYVSHFVAYEKFIMSSSSLEARSFRNALNLRPGPEQTPVIHDKDKAALFNFLVACRLIDLTAHIYGFVCDIPVPRHLRDSELWTSCRPFHKHFQDCRKVMRNFKTSMGPSIPPLVVSTHRTLDVRLRLLKSFLRSNKLQGSANVLANFDLAALYFIYVGHHDFASNVLPDIPSTAVDVISFVTQQIESSSLNENFTSAEQEGLHEFFHGITASGFRLPVQIITMITPLVLLLPLKISTWDWNKMDMLQLSRKLGNMRPTIIAEVEQLVMNTLTDIATGKKDTQEAVQKLAESIDLEVWNRCDNTISEWFSTSIQPSPKKLPPLEMNIEAPIEIAWPLCTVLETEMGDGYRVHGKPFACSTPLPIDQPTSINESDTQVAGHQNSTIGSHGTVSQESQSRPQVNEIEDRETSNASDTMDNFKDGSKALVERRKSGRMIKPKVPADEVATLPALRPKAAPKKRNRLPAEKATKSETPMPTMQIFGPGSVYYNPINVDQLDTPMSSKTLDLSGGPKKFTNVDVSFTAYGPLGEEAQIVPTMHDEDDLHRFKSFITTMEQLHVDGTPLHIRKPELSVFKVLTFVEFKALSVKEVQNLLRTQHLVLTNVPGSKLEFNQKGLRTMRNASNTIAIHDQSISIPDKESCNIRLKEGTLRDLINAGNDPNGKILNALSFPMGWTMGLAGWHPASYSTEITAWQATQGMQFAKEDTELPVIHFQFGLAATKGAITWWHIDGPFGTTLTVKAGSKFLFVARPPLGSSNPLTPQSFDKFAHLELFEEANFEMERGANPLWDVEGIHLTPGTKLIMRPNTPHCVYTTENAIVHGSHFFATSALKDSSYALIHSFVSYDLLAATSHPGSRMMLQRIIMFYYRAFVDNALEDDDPDLEYLPDLTNMEDVINFITICFQGILMNVLDPRTYEAPPVEHGMYLHVTFDVNGLSYRDRRTYVYIRRISWQLLRWFIGAYEAHTCSGDHHTEVDIWYEMCLPYLARQAVALVKYKRLSADNGLPGASFQSVFMQLLHCLHLVHGVLEEMKKPPADINNDFAYVWERSHIISKRNVEDQYLDDLDDDWGLTIRDKLFFGYSYSSEESSVEEEEPSSVEEAGNSEDTRRAKKRRV